MKLYEAKAIMKAKPARTGFIVSFEVRERGMLRSDHFPDVRNGEPGIPTKARAWMLARAFAAKRTTERDIVNVRLCSASNFTPIDYPECLNEYPPGEAR